MSSKKRRGEANVGSNRNLDGRRLRSVAEAKALAEYLALKPDMDRKEREERRKRWEQVVELAEAKEREHRQGGQKVRLDGKWVEAKEESENKTREAVLKALREGKIDVDMESDESPSLSEEEGTESDVEVEAKAESSKKESTARTFAGWDDEDDEFMSSDEEEEEEAAKNADLKGKGKAKA